MRPSGETLDLVRPGISRVVARTRPGVGDWVAEAELYNREKQTQLVYSDPINDCTKTVSRSNQNARAYVDRQFKERTKESKQERNQLTSAEMTAQ